MDSDEIDFAAWRTFEHTGWEAAAAGYEDALGRVTRQLVEPLLDRARIAAGMQVLDVASGPGYAAAAAGSRGAHVVGIDFSERMIERAWWKYPGIEFRKGDAENLPVGDGVFDAVVCNFGVLHFGDPEKAFGEAFRVLSHGGRLAFTTWRTDDPAAGFGLIHAAIAQGAEPIALPNAAPYARFADPAVIESVLMGIGFRYVSSAQESAVWTISGADEICDALERGGVRTAALLRGQPPERTAAVRRLIDAGLQRYKAAEGFALPMPAILACATKP